MKEKPFNSGRWTNARFFGFIRSALRSASLKWPPRNDARNAARRKYEGPDKRRKWEYQCAICGAWFSGADTQLDHVRPCGSLRDFSDLPDFVRTLFCEQDNFQVVCLNCHAAKGKNL